MHPRLPILLVMVVSALGGGCHGILHKQEDAPGSGAAHAANSGWLSPPPIEESRIPPGEELVIWVVDQDPPGRPVRALVMEDGTVTLASNKVFSAAGKTRTQLEAELHDYYVPRSSRGYVVIKFGDAPLYFISGEVRSPGRATIFRRTTALKAIELAGGFTESANQKKVEITRADGTKHIINCMKAQHDTAADLQVYQGDRICVPRSFWKHMFSPSKERLPSGSGQ
jgi:polysaccharide biosynthesis/export protein VpsN